MDLTGKCYESESGLKRKIHAQKQVLQMITSVQQEVYARIEQVLAEAKLQLSEQEQMARDFETIN